MNLVGKGQGWDEISGCDYAHAVVAAEKPVFSIVVILLTDDTF
jgi:hypothetical protein